jgi:hypothetical protein
LFLGFADVKAANLNLSYRQHLQSAEVDLSGDECEYFLTWSLHNPRMPIVSGERSQSLTASTQTVNEVQKP